MADAPTKEILNSVLALVVGIGLLVVKVAPYGIIAYFIYKYGPMLILKAFFTANVAVSFIRGMGWPTPWG